METLRSKYLWLGFFPIAVGVIRIVVNTMLIMRIPPFLFAYTFIIPMLMILGMGAYYLFRFKQIKLLGHIGMLSFLLGGGMLLLNNFIYWAFSVPNVIPTTPIIIVESIGYVLLGLDAWVLKPISSVSGIALLLLAIQPAVANFRNWIRIPDMASIILSYEGAIGWILLGIAFYHQSMSKPNIICASCNQVVMPGDVYCTHCRNALDAT